MSPTIPSPMRQSSTHFVGSVNESDCKVTDHGPHVQRVLNRIDGLPLRVCGEECHLHRGKISLHSARRNLKFIGLPTGHSSQQCDAR